MFHQLRQGSIDHYKLKDTDHRNLIDYHRYTLPKAKKIKDSPIID